MLAAPAVALDQRPSNTTCVAPALSGGGGGVKIQRAFGSLSFTQPTQIRQHPNDSSRFYLSERRGLIKAFNRDGGSVATALDIIDRMSNTAKDSTHSEQWGITSFAFDPSFASRPYIYVAYNRRPPGSTQARSYVSRFRADSSGRAFTSGSEQVLFSLAQDRPWHHVGQIHFGPDGRLYVGSGDGGDRTRAQSTSSYHGKILRIDVNTTPPAVAIHARGLRNPWRFWFDGDALWIGDVGWNTTEEINRITGSGTNLGWPIYEGLSCIDKAKCGTTGLTRPVHTFGHSVGSAVIGGQVYRGSRIPSLVGHYIFGVGSGPRLMALAPSGFTTRNEIGQLPQGRATGFYRDTSGEIFAYDTVNNGVWELFGGGGSGGEVATLLSDSGCVVESDPKRFASGVIPYDVNQPLWSDGTDKSRGFALPNGSRIGLGSDGDFQLPTGTVTVKSFRLDGATIETRLMMNHPNGVGWRGYSYEWTGSDGRLVESSGKTKTFSRVNKPSLTWLYPSRSQCMQCHTQAAGVSLSLETAQVNRSFTYANGKTRNQIDVYRAIGLFNTTVPPASNLPALATRTSGTVSERARAYLHANCSHCHRPDGGGRIAADMRYTRATKEMRVCWEPPATESFNISGAHVLTPGAPSKSLISVRTQRRDQFGMPPVGSRLVDSDMVGVINNWILAPGVCD